MIGFIRRVLLALATAPVRLYQVVISPALPRRCKYEPSCSSYAISALRSYGIVRGSILAGWRILRCNPWSHGGHDPVESQTVFRGRAAANERHEHPGATA